MKTHPVPQNIMDVEFKLFGELTIRQFGYVAGGAVMAFFCYLIFTEVWVVRWPLVVLFGLLGIMLALFKVNDRPFEVWLANFIYSMFTSQRKVWRKSNTIPQVLKMPGNSKIKVDNSVSVNKLPLSTLYLSNQSQKTLTDIEEEERLNSLSAMLGGKTYTPKHISINPAIAATSIPLINKEVEKEVDVKKVENVVLKTDVVENKKIHSSNIDAILPDKFDKDELIKEIDEKAFKQVVEPEPVTNMPTSTLTTKNSVATKIEEKPTQSNQEEYINRLRSELSSQNELINKYKTGNVSPVQEIKIVPTKVINDFSEDEKNISHTKANIVLGEVKGKNGKGISNVTIIIKDSRYVPVRALKSNNFGRFSVTTPLDNGNYNVEASKEGYEFDSIDFSLNGTSSKYLDIIEI